MGPADCLHRRADRPPSSNSAKVRREKMRAYGAQFALRHTEYPPSVLLGNYFRPSLFY